MLTTKNGIFHTFVGTDAERDKNERDGTVMYDFDPFGGVETVAFDGKEWLVDKIAVEPRPMGES